MAKKWICLLLAMTMLCGLCACGQGDTPSGDYEQVAEEYIEAYYLRNLGKRFSMLFLDTRRQWEDKIIADNGSAEAFFATAQQQAAEKGFEVTIDSFDSFYDAYHQFILKDCEGIYGEGFEVTVSTTESTKLEGEELSQFVEQQLAAVDAEYVDADAYRAITEAYTVVVHLHVEGPLKTHDESYQVQVGYHDGKWLVLSHSI